MSTEVLPRVPNDPAQLGQPLGACGALRGVRRAVADTLIAIGRKRRERQRGSRMTENRATIAQHPDMGAPRQTGWHIARLLGPGAGLPGARSLMDQVQMDSSQGRTEIRTTVRTVLG